jgi:hypothetical protein
MCKMHSKPNRIPVEREITTCTLETSLTTGNPNIPFHNNQFVSHINGSTSKPLMVSSILVPTLRSMKPTAMESQATPHASGVTKDNILNLLPEFLLLLWKDTPWKTFEESSCRQNAPLG